MVYLCLHSCPDVSSDSRHTGAGLEIGLMSAFRVGGVILVSEGGSSTLSTTFFYF